MITATRMPQHQQTDAALAATDAVVVDHVFATYSQGWKLATTYLVRGTHRVRVRITRDFYEQQSTAVAEVLAPALVWTEVATWPPALWHGDLRSAATVETELRAWRAAADLAARAGAILP